jgi:hypothetical protein
MKIAIYGDSWADNQQTLHDPNNLNNFQTKIFKKAFKQLGYTNKDVFIHNINSKYKCWVDMLSEKFTVTTYAQGGSDCYFSYKKFLETHDQYDKIIFLKTFPGRLSLHDGIWYHYINPSSILEDDKVSSVIKDFFVYVQPKDNFRFELFDNLMIEDVLRKRPETLYIDVDSSNTTQSIPLYDIYKTESILWNIDFENNNYVDARQCHMSYENNVMIFNKIYDSIVHSVPFSLSRLDIVEPGNKDNYIFNSVNDFINFVMR